MRAGAPSDVLAAAAGYRVRVDSYLGGDVLASDIPVAGGVFKLDSTTRTIESATLAVPVYEDGRSWLPGADTRHPLGRYGQELTFTAVMDAGSQSWETPLGRARIDSWREDGGDVEVSLTGSALGKVADARLPRPIVPRKDGTLESELRRLMPAGIPVDVDAALIDRDCPSSFQWDEERIDAVYDVVDAWPARLAPDGLGGLVLLPELDEDEWVSAFTFTDGEGGTVASAPREDTRERVYNHVIARAQSDDTDAPIVQGEAQMDTGPFAVSTYGDVPRYYSSPALKTKAQCESAAASILAKSLRPSRTIGVVASVDPRIELFDPVTVVFDYVEYRGWVIGLDLPLTPGDMGVTVSVFAARDLPRPNPDRNTVVPTSLGGPVSGFYLPLGPGWIEVDGLFALNSLISDDDLDGLFVEV